jgi:hypothetical protein
VGGRVGFLKFLKRDKSKEPSLDLENLDDLDMPPLPPEAGEKDFGSVEKEFPELPELPEMPETEETFPEIKEKPIPELEVPSEKPVPELKTPSMPEFPKPMEARKPKFPRPRPLFGVQKPRPVADEQQLPPKPEIKVPKKAALEIKPYERMERAAVREEQAVLRHKEAKKAIFIRVDRFRDILTGTYTIRNNLKTAEQSIVKLNEIDANRNKVLEKWGNVMADMQKKLIFIDKTLFKR